MWWLGVREFVEFAVGMPGGLAVELDGELVEIGGIGEESVTISDGNGMTILADLDGDGVVDHVTTHNYSGSYEVWSRAASQSGWGLPGAATSNPAISWGLESDTAPERGREVITDAPAGSPWRRIDRG